MNEIVKYSYTDNTNYISIMENIEDCYTKQIKPFISYLKEYASDLNEVAIQEYFKELNESNYSASTIRVRRQAVKKRVEQIYFNADSETREKVKRFLELLDKDPNTKAPKINTENVDSEKYLDEKQIDKLVKVCRSNKQRLFILFLYKTGCRVAEMANIKLDDVTEQNGKAIIRVMGKGKKERFIKIKNDLFNEIHREFEGKTYLFETGGNKKYECAYISNQIKRIGKLINRNISAHTLRHSFCTNMIHKTNKIKGVSKYVGHANVSTTMNMYVHESLLDDELGI
jgi:integrase